MKFGLSLIISLSMLSTSCSPRVEVQTADTRPSDKIIKRDKTIGARKMRTYRLPNQMEVLLISDPKANKGAAAVDVRVGSQSNPEEHLGMAHYLEHMLFLGTKKYPDPGEYNDHLGKYQGSHNAYTSVLSTNYFFDANHEGFEEALDRFAQFFVAPLFDPKYVEREKNAVNSEHSKNIQNDGWRGYRMIGLLTKEGHPQQKFGTGTTETLANTSREDLIKFYEKYYSADRMKLVVISNRNLESLEELVKKSFSEVPQRSVKSDPAITQLFSEEDLPRVVYVKPVANLKEVSFLFEVPMPSLFSKSKPAELLASVIGYEGKGSLIAAFKNEGLATAASTEFEDLGLSGLFSLKVSLTDKGLEQIERIGELFYSYTKLLKTNGFAKYFYEEQKLIRQLGFDYRDLPQGASAASGFASSMQLFPVFEIEELESLIYNYSEEDINYYLSYLTPEKSTMMVTAPNVETTDTEKYYGIEYKIEKLNPDWLRAFLDVEVLPSLNFPAPNTKMPKSENLKLVEETLKLPNPTLLSESEFGETYFSSDSKFKQPKSFVSVDFVSESIGHSPRSLLLANLYQKAIVESLNEKLYELLLAGSTVKLDLSQSKLTLTYSGYSSEVQDKLLEIVSSLKDITISESTFEDIKKSFADELDNLKYEIAYSLARYELDSVSLSSFVHRGTVSKMIDTVTLDELKTFSQNELFKSVAIKSFVYGNEKSDNWKYLAKKVSAQLQAKPLAKKLWENVKALKWKTSKSMAYKVSAEANNNNVWWTKIQFGPRSDLKAEAVLEFAQVLFSDSFYSYMRTDKQVGYIVYAGMTKLLNAMGYQFLAQSSTFSAEEMAKLATDWISDQKNWLANLNPADIESLRQPIIDKLKEEPHMMSEKFTVLVEEAREYNGDFDHRKKLIEVLKSLSVSDIKKEILNGLNLKKGGQVSVYYSAAGANKAVLLPNETEITNPEEFRKLSEVY